MHVITVETNATVLPFTSWKAIRNPVFKFHLFIHLANCVNKKAWVNLVTSSQGRGEMPLTPTQFHPVPNLFHPMWRTHSLSSFPTALVHVISLPTPAQLPRPHSLPTFLLSSFFPSYLPLLPSPPLSVLICHSSFSSPSLWWFWSTSSSQGQSVWASSVKRTSSPSKPWRTFSTSTRTGKTREQIVSCSRLCSSPVASFSFSPPSLLSSPPSLSTPHPPWLHALTATCISGNH